MALDLLPMHKRKVVVLFVLAIAPFSILLAHILFQYFLIDFIQVAMDGSPASLLSLQILVLELLHLLHKLLLLLSPRFDRFLFNQLVLADLL